MAAAATAGSLAAAAGSLAAATAGSLAAATAAGSLAAAAAGSLAAAAAAPSECEAPQPGGVAAGFCFERPGRLECLLECPLGWAADRAPRAVLPARGVVFLLWLNSGEREVAGLVSLVFSSRSCHREGAS